MCVAGYKSFDLLTALMEKNHEVIVDQIAKSLREQSDNTQLIKRNFALGVKKERCVSLSLSLVARLVGKRETQIVQKAVAILQVWKGHEVGVNDPEFILLTPRKENMLLLIRTVIFITLASGFRAAASRNLITLNEDTWTDILQGEWMVEFYAPWCPACKDLQKAWHSFADWSKDLNINVAEVDVTVNPGLSGRFLVTALPTIYHVKDGVFRAYSGSRDKNDFISFIEEKKWTLYDPIPSYKHPSSPQMTIVAWFFKLSMFVRDQHNYFVDEVGIPSWASYSVFAAVTLALGCVLGFCIVCIIDRVFPTAGQLPKPEKKQTKKEQKAKPKKDEGKKKEEDESQDEKHSQTEDSTDENARNRKATGGSKSEVKKKK